MNQGLPRSLQHEVGSLEVTGLQSQFYLLMLETAFPAGPQLIPGTETKTIRIENARVVHFLSGQWWSVRPGRLLSPSIVYLLSVSTFALLKPPATQRLQEDLLSTVSGRMNHGMKSSKMQPNSRTGRSTIFLERRDSAQQAIHTQDRGHSRCPSILSHTQRCRNG